MNRTRPGHIVVVLVALVVMLVSGCSADEEEFPYGAWAVELTDQLQVIDFRADGSLWGGVGAPGQDPQTVALEDLAGSASYSVSGDVLTFTGACPEPPEMMEATYRWGLDGDEVTLDIISDACAYRAEQMEGAVLTRVTRPSGAPMASAQPVAAPIPWWNEQVFYEVFVRSFADSNGDGIGDLRGLINTLDYLNDGDPGTDDDLGVTALWLMPVAQSPSYHGYDTTDHYTVEQDYGTNDDFGELMDQADQRGIKVIVDLMLNHTSSEHPWFVDSAGSPTSPKRDWYVWSDSDPGHRSPWDTPIWHPRNGAYFHGLFWEGMPDLNFRTAAVTEQMYDVARFWMEDMGVDGFRLDAVRHLIEDGDRYDGTPETHDWLVAWDDFIDTIDSQALSVGEVWDDTSSVVPYVVDDEVDVAFEFTLAESILRSVSAADPTAFAAQLRRVLAEFPPGQFAPFLTNHDQDRVMTQLGGDPDQAKLAAGVLLTLPGVPFVYYGEEIGMVGQKPDEQIRTPMQWDSTEGAGFTDGIPWQPINADAATVNVAAQDGDPSSLLDHYRRLIHVRSAHPALSVGALDTMASSCPGLNAQLRTTREGTDTVLVVHNFSDTAETGCTLGLASSPLAEGSLTATDLLTGAPMDPMTVGAGGVIEDYQPTSTIAPRQTVIISLTP